jgi:hypothetical protein
MTTAMMMMMMMMMMMSRDLPFRFLCLSVCLYSSIKICSWLNLKKRIPPHAGVSGKNLEEDANKWEISPFLFHF